MNSKPITKHPAISTINIESICAMIADTNEGLTGSEITKLYTKEPKKSSFLIIINSFSICSKWE